MSVMTSANIPPRIDDSQSSPQKSPQNTGTGWGDTFEEEIDDKTKGKVQKLVQAYLWPEDRVTGLEANLPVGADEDDDRSQADLDLLSEDAWDEWLLASDDDEVH